MKNINIQKTNIIEKLKKAEEDYNNGKIRKAEDVFKEWNTKFILKYKKT